MKNVYASLLTLLVVFAPLSAIADTWGDQINDPTRFVVLPGYGGAAVLDQETGLVWEQSPRTTVLDQNGASSACNDSRVGNRKGWRLPTIQELASLVDPSQSNLALPVGHPFSVVVSPTLNSDFIFLSVNTAASPTSPGAPWIVRFTDGLVDAGCCFGNFGFWCVRGGQGVNPQ